MGRRVITPQILESILFDVNVLRISSRYLIYLTPQIFAQIPSFDWRCLAVCSAAMQPTIHPKMQGDRFGHEPELSFYPSRF